MMKSYSSYTISKIPDVDQVPESWSEKRFRYIFDTMKGLTITKENLQDEGIPCINYGEIHSKYGFEVDTRRDKLRFVSEDYLGTNGKSLLQKGDLIFADTSEDVEGSGNFTQLINDGQAFAGYHTIIARPKSGYHPRFLAYFIESTAFRSQVQRAIKGVKVFSITNAILKSSFLLIPTLNEQQVIASYLDRQTQHIDNLIAEKRNFISLLEEKRQALISHVVTKGLDDSVEMKNSGVEWIGEVPAHWNIEKIKHSLKSVESGTSVNSESTPADHGKYGVLKTSCVSNGYFAPEENKQVINDDELRVSCPVKANRLIVSRMNTPELVGACGYTDKSYPNLFLPDRLWQLDFSERVNTKYIFYWAQTASYRDQIRSVCVGTSSSMQNLSQDDFKNFKLPIPPKSTQDAIVERIDKSNESISKIKLETLNSVALLRERRSALISAAVTGKIDVREAV